MTDTPHTHDHGDHVHDEHDHGAHDHSDHDRSDAQLQGWLKAALLLGLGLYFVYNLVSGSLSNYINARFAWLSVVAAVIFLVLGAVSVFDLLRGHGDHDHADAHAEYDHGHDHDHGLSWPVLAVVALPLLFGTLIPSRPLGADAIDGSLTTGGGLIGSEGASELTVAPLERNILDWLRVINDTGDLTALNGQAARLVGFVYQNEQFPADHLMVTRFLVSCCVADASAIGLPVYWAGAADLPNDTWIEVEGTFQLGEFNGNLFPILQVEALSEIPEPEHPYLYP